MINWLKRLRHRPVEWYWTTVFWITVGVKTGNGLLEVIGGIVLLLAPRPLARQLGRWLLHLGIIERFQDPLTRVVAELLHFITPNLRLFYGSYLLIHGLANIIMVISLAMKKVWGYYFTFVFIGLLTLYQAVRLFHHSSLILVILTILDIAFLVLTYHQYKRFLRTHQAKTQQN
jgi:uncharacterized membrane protein